MEFNSKNDFFFKKNNLITLLNFQKLYSHFQNYIKYINILFKTFKLYKAYSKSFKIAYRQIKTNRIYKAGLIWEDKIRYCYFSATLSSTQKFMDGQSIAPLIERDLFHVFFDLRGGKYIPYIIGNSQTNKGILGPKYNERGIFDPKV